VVNLVALLLLVGVYLFVVRKSWASQERSL
jgi:hypothetical protein